MAIIVEIPEGDIALNDQGTWFLVEGVELVRQRLVRRFKFFRGEWFLDTRLGLPYFEVILGVRNPNIPVITALLRQTILMTPGVTGLNSLAADFDRSARVLSVAFEATTASGPIVVTAEDREFLLDFS